MKVLVTGANGFLGKNLIIRLNELGYDILTFTRENTLNDLKDLLIEADFIVHLAGENRPADKKLFNVNYKLTLSICEILLSLGKLTPIMYASSIQAEMDNEYGRSKLNAEKILIDFSKKSGSPTLIYRFPGIFGKWCKPNYNSVVATFCFNISRNLPIQIHEPNHQIALVYIDDVVREILSVIQNKKFKNDVLFIKPEYKIKLGDLAEQIKKFRNSRSSLVSERVGDGFIRKLYSTYMSYISPEDFSYPIKSYNDERGIFSEVLKTKDSGQFSFFSALPGVTRGGHYHHSKTEKFLVIQGKARFRFRHIISNEKFEMISSEKKLEIIETCPGWSHNIKNIGESEMLVLLWANEVFDEKNSDTILFKV